MPTLQTFPIRNRSKWPDIGARGTTEKDIGKQNMTLKCCFLSFPRPYVIHPRGLEGQEEGAGAGLFRDYRQSGVDPESVRMRRALMHTQTSAPHLAGRSAR
ncbi:hypothetical protein EVAR_53989_1 [Eumeta japonica]|uniref:Uncharacterized protein n=1 Tax=Eumeta variegata TaxID=151549 RepID=A0A4C1YTK4_EUMVA|nr:hypothetical protein EVAR_53989_1 [Eumeta japonica]